MAQRRTHIVSDSDILDGQPRIEGHRISVLQIHDEVELRGNPPAVVANRYGLDVATVYRALAYYHEHPAEMAAAQRRREQCVDAARAEALTPEDLE